MATELLGTHGQAEGYATTRIILPRVTFTGQQPGEEEAEFEDPEEERERDEIEREDQGAKEEGRRRGRIG
jgi:hypothetical protein